MAKKKKKDPVEILANAEKFYQRENYPLALTEFEKAQKKLKTEAIAEKIDFCRKKTSEIKAKDLLKRAEKLFKKNKIDDALKCYEQSNALFQTEFVQKKIRDLKNLTERKNAAVSAKEAESSGDFSKAAELYGMAAKTVNSENNMKRSASCYVKAGEYLKAIEIFEKISLSTKSLKYDYGFALAKTGRFCECLISWEELNTTDQQFLSQKSAVCHELAKTLFQRFDEKRDIQSVADDLTRLLNTGLECFNESMIKALEGLQKTCFYQQLEDLFVKESFLEAAELLQNVTWPMSPELIALKAKLYFKLAEKEEKYLPKMMKYWVTAIYSEEVSSRFSEDPDKKRKIQQKMIESADDLIKKYKNSKFAVRAACHLKTDTSLIETLLNLSKDQADSEHIICTPEYAELTGKTDIVLNFIRANKANFKTGEDYFKTGAYYSEAGKCLYLAKTGDFQKACDYLDELPRESKNDILVDYASKEVFFEYGLSCINDGTNKYLKFFNGAADLFDKSPSCEKKLTDKALGAEDDSERQHYENVLLHIYKTRPSKLISEALSMVMARRALFLYDNLRLTEKVFLNKVKKAMNIDPENEFARSTYETALINYQSSEISKAIGMNKIGKASRIAIESDSQEVRENYFDFISIISERMDSEDIPDEMKLTMLEEFYAYSIDVDSDHYVLDNLKSKISIQEQVLNK